MQDLPNLRIGGLVRKSADVPGFYRRKQSKEFNFVRRRKLFEFTRKFVEFGFAGQPLVPVAVENEMMRTQENILEVLIGVAERSFEKHWRSADDAMCCLKNKLH